MKVLITTAIYPTAENPAFGSFVRTQVETLRKAGVHVDVLVLNGRVRKLIYPKGIFQLRKRLRSGPGYDVIHAHYGYVGMVARTQFRLPVVVTYHGDDLLGTVNERGKKSHASTLIVAAGQVLARLADSVIVQSEEMADKIPYRDAVYVIPHEIDLDVFRPAPRDIARAALKLDLNKKYLLFAANPAVPVKRYPFARQVADHLRNEDPSIELLVAYREPQERLALLMSACDALVFPSYQEGSPNIVKQAMACNLPIVATDVGDVRGVIGTTAHCYICGPDVSEFAQRLAGILRCPCRTNGRQQVQHLAGPVVAKQIIRVYEDTLRRVSA